MKNKSKLKSKHANDNLETRALYWEKNGKSFQRHEVNKQWLGYVPVD